MSPGREVVCVRDDRRFFDVWPAVEALEEAGRRPAVRGVSAAFADLVPDRWRLDAGERAAVAWWTDRSLRCLALALGTRTLRWRPLEDGARPRDLRGPAISEEERAWARDRWCRAGARDGQPIVAIRVGRGRVGSRVRLVRALRRACPGACVALLVLPGEATLWTAVRVHERVVRASPVVGPEARGGRLPALLGRVRGLVGDEDAVLALGRLLGLATVVVRLPRRGGDEAVRVAVERLEALLAESGAADPKTLSTGTRRRDE